VKTGTTFLLKRGHIVTVSTLNEVTAQKMWLCTVLCR